MHQARKRDPNVVGGVCPARLDRTGGDDDWLWRHGRLEIVDECAAVPTTEFGARATCLVSAPRDISAQPNQRGISKGDLVTRRLVGMMRQQRPVVAVESDSAAAADGDDVGGISSPHARERTEILG